MFLHVGIEEAKLFVELFGEPTMPNIFMVADVLTQTIGTTTSRRYVISGIVRGHRIFDETLEMELIKFEDFDREAFKKLIKDKMEEIKPKKATRTASARSR